ncbi:hypothetical protein NKH77_16615 [Streptomyces sp. M19]
MRDLTERRPVPVRLCAARAAGGELWLPAGRHRVESGDAGPLALTDVTLRTGEPPAPATPGVRTVRARDWSGDRRTVVVGPGQSVYLQTYENDNPGWKATFNGRSLTPVRLDGWQQGFLVPAGPGGTVTLFYEPSTAYRAGWSAARWASWRCSRSPWCGPRGRRRRGPPARAPGARLVLGTVALTAVVVLVAGPLAVAVPVLALLAWWRPGLLAPVALVAMAAAGVTAALGAGRPVGGARARSARWPRRWPWWRWWRRW